VSEPTTFTAEFKARAVLDMLTGAKTAAAISAEYAIPESVLEKWRETFIARAPLVFVAEEVEAAKNYARAMNPVVRSSLERSIQENADVWAELAKH
jgi:transposase-like protein